MSGSSGASYKSIEPLTGSLAYRVIDEEVSPAFLHNVASMWKYPSNAYTELVSLLIKIFSTDEQQTRQKPNSKYQKA